MDLAFHACGFSFPSLLMSWSVRNGMAGSLLEKRGEVKWGVGGIEVWMSNEYPYRARL